MKFESTENLVQKLQDLENRLAEAEQLIEAIKAGEVDAFAMVNNNNREIYTLQSGDYAYRVLVEKFNEGAINLTEDGLIVYSNSYFFNFLKLPYEKVVSTYIFDHIAPDSIIKFNSLFALALHGSSKGELNILVNGDITPVYVSLTSLQPTLPTIGVIITDLTEKKSHEKLITGYQAELEEKNKMLALKNAELTNQNAELASFSYIASHDLQEPLRKIQAFTSRIFQKEADHLSEVGKDYFNRINNAAARMQTLIEALLSYSRTNTADLLLEYTDLNVLLNDVLIDMQDEIQDKNVLIEAGKLPELNIVPQQFHQLFSNIISNAIKYRKPDVQPVIKISSRESIPEQVKHSGVKYWHISIEDNGIGFDPQYEMKIFELFQRLHSKSEFEGTGIGLAICKKIIQNHNGFITAKGIPGIGATFNIFIPMI
jgi:signal transduction histidine kinase